MWQVRGPPFLFPWADHSWGLYVREHYGSVDPDYQAEK